MKLLREAKKRKDELQRQLEKIETFKQHEPEGTLKCHLKGKGGHPFYTCLFKDKESGRYREKYISKKNGSIELERLAAKTYYHAVEKSLRKELTAVEYFLKNYHPKEEEEAYHHITKERRSLVRPLRPDVQEALEVWRTEIYEGNTYHEENKTFSTQQGEKVRSKSEALIANLLYQQRDKILYKYERPLVLMCSNGTSKTVYPDFTALNLCTGELSYLEHAGRMDDPRYAVDFVHKVKLYADNGIVIGKNLFVTFETYSEALDLRMVDETIRQMIGEE